MDGLGRGRTKEDRADRDSRQGVDRAGRGGWRPVGCRSSCALGEVCDDVVERWRDRDETSVSMKELPSP